MADRSAAFADQLNGLRERGAQRIEPICCDLIESLLRRAAAHGGDARRVMDDKAAALLQALTERVAQAEAKPIGSMTADVQGGTAGGALAELLAHVARQKPRVPAAVDATPSSKSKLASTPSRVAHESPVDAKTLQFFRRTWSKLNSDQRLAQSRSSLPDNAGPLNSQHLVHRSLNLMRELSPAYFDLFISHVDALLWLEKTNEQAVKDVGLSPRPKGSKKTAATRRG